MTYAILSLILFGYVLIAYEHLTHINKATIALFAAVVGWILFMCTGTDFVLKMHGPEFAEFTGGGAFTSETVKQFIASNVFIGYGAQLCSIVLFVLATMNIVNVLNANGCFDFITDTVRTKDSRVLLWGLVGFTWLLSVNLDNLTTTVLMLMIMRRIVQQTRWRAWIGSAIVIAANCGGATSVIGDLTSLVVWTKGAVTPTDFTAALILPTLVATVIPTALISRALPSHIDIIRPSTYYRGDQSTLHLWQKIAMLVVGLGGLWFIPTFHRITLLPPFLGALCVLGVLWVLHEVMNHRRIKSNQPLFTAEDRQFQFAALQTVMYFVGIFLCVALLIETGVMGSISAWCDEWIHNIYIMSIAIGAISAVLDNIALVLTAINIYPVAESIASLSPTLDPSYADAFLQNGQYWHLIIYSGCVAGCLLPIGNVSGFTLMKAEEVSISWYARHIMPKVFLGWGVGLGIYFLVDLWLR
ncbi:MAG: sodium:proton antiporter [Bacteroidaceae bacterium]|nr:sodium:proton antiporter [Bacteroidaceae bacterium]MBR1800137.1 sodium:proton antiporter [Bacteroidaceae bacterium]